MQVTKQQVDRFCIFHNDLPKCEFSMKWCSTGSPPKRLMHKVDLIEGTANSEKYFVIDFNPLQNPAPPQGNYHIAVKGSNFTIFMKNRLLHGTVTKECLMGVIVKIAPR